MWKECEHKDFKLVKYTEEHGFLLKTNSSAILECVHNLTSTFIFPFILSRDQVDSFIVALIKPEMVSGGPDVETKNIVTKRQEETVDLICNFKLNDTFSKGHISVYWIKITNERSTCIYSFYLGDYGEQEYYRHCPVDESLHKRMSNISTANKENHSLKINQVTHSDSGQYVCALYVQENENKWYGKVISNITVTVKDNSTSTNQSHDKNNLIILYVVGALLLFCFFATVIVMKKKIKNSQAKHKTLGMNRNQDGEETLDCSPYAVGTGDQGPYSLVKHPEVRDPVTVQNRPDEYAPADSYDVIMFNPEYEAIDSGRRQTSST
ncbi:uncharacterized protein LOC114828654 isoform X1 [Esox lucius]|uniref:uncharacterized protein LOC114828654 isoform X1 n=2 Tax=Esox lucius TaxID=8010 RepID=UPI000661D324|nr:uncharacterized protein LOC114828654 isoform X1 [Esox lucius]